MLAASTWKNDICAFREEFAANRHPSEMQVSPERRNAVAEAVGTWSFSAHDFTDDELLYGALIILQHALSMPELEKWRLSEGNIIFSIL